MSMCSSGLLVIYFDRKYSTDESRNIFSIEIGITIRQRYFV